MKKIIVISTGLQTIVIITALFAWFSKYHRKPDNNTDVQEENREVVFARLFDYSVADGLRPVWWLDRVTKPFAAQSGDWLYARVWRGAQKVQV